MINQSIGKEYDSAMQFDIDDKKLASSAPNVFVTYSPELHVLIVYVG